MFPGERLSQRPLDECTVLALEEDRYLTTNASCTESDGWFPHDWMSKRCCNGRHSGIDLFLSCGYKPAVDSC
jgi:hypothetical protein